MRTLPAVPLLLCFLLLLTAACDNSVPPIPTPALTPLSVEPGPTLPPHQAGSMPARILDRKVGSQNYVLSIAGTPFPQPSPIPNMTFQIELTNLTGKDLKVIRGVFIFKDPTGKTIDSSNTPYYDIPMKAGETVVIDHDIIDSEYIEGRKIIKTHPISELAVRFSLKSLTTADGATELVEPVP